MLHAGSAARRSSSKGCGQVNHEQREIGGVGDGGWRDVHEVFQTPELLGISEIELDLEPEPIVVNHVVVGQGRVARK